MGTQKKRKEATEAQYWLYSVGNFPNNIIFLMVGTYITYFIRIFADSGCNGRHHFYGGAFGGCSNRSDYGDDC